MKSGSARRGIPTKQQQNERDYFEMFRKVYPLPAGTIRYGDKPDVIVDGTQKLGIEITNFYLTGGASASSEQVQRKRREAAVFEGQRLYQQSGMNTELIFGFSQDHPIQDVRALARRLASLGQHVEGCAGQISRDIFEGDIPELDFAYALREQSQSPAKWSVMQSHRFGLMSTTRLTDIIREKEAKARQYITCEAYWLLIVVDFKDSAQEQEIRIDGLTIKSDVFQKKIVYKTNFEHVVEI
jgi:hypothetical protein